MSTLIAGLDTAAVLSWAIPVATLVVVALWLVISLRRDENRR